MLIYAIDDERNMLYLLHAALAEAAPEAEIEDFRLGSMAIAHIEESGARPDAIFSDIAMPGISGLELAARLKQIAPRTKLVFVTGYDYAMNAYQLHVDGYIPKPVEAERIREELDHLFPDDLDTQEKLKVRCFGMFEAFWKDRPLPFADKQSKELLAYLVEQRGARCSTDDIIAALWKDNTSETHLKHRVWNLKNDLRSTMSRIGVKDVLIIQGQRIGVRTSLLDCDYYQMLEGDETAKRSFRGTYMEQYDWAEQTRANLLVANSYRKAPSKR